VSNNEGNTGGPMPAYTEAEKRGDFSESNCLFGQIVDWLT